MTTPCTTPCTRCGTLVADEELRCPTCDALAPVPEDAPAPQHPSVADDTRVDGNGADGTMVDAPPWAIPIREPAGAARTPAAPPLAHRLRNLPRDTVRTAALALLAVVAFAATVVIGAQLLTDGDGARNGTVDGADLDAAAPADARPVRAGAETDDTETREATTTSAPTTTAATSTSTSTTTTPTTMAPTTTTAAAPGTGSVPELSSSFRGGWVAQLTSVPYSAGTTRLEAAWEAARADVPGAVATRSDDWSSLRDGFWVLVEPGPFASADDVRAFCARAGQADSDECLPRQLDGRR